MLWSNMWTSADVLFYMSNRFYSERFFMRGRDYSKAAAVAYE
jgi:hypothetical protein